MASRDHLRSLGAFLRRHRGEVVAAAACLLVVVAAMFALPGWAATLVRDRVTGNDLWALATHLGVGVAIVAALSAATFGRDYLLMRLSVRFVAALRESMVSRILRQPLATLARTTAADLLSRVSNDVAALQHALVRGLAIFAPNVIVVALLLVAMVATSWPLLIGTLVLAVPMLALVNRFGRRLHGVVHGSQAGLAEMIALLADALDGAKEVKSFGSESMLAERFRRLSARSLSLALREERMIALHPAAVTVAGLAGLAGMVFISAWLHQLGLVSASSLVRFLVLLGLIAGPLQETARSTGAVARFFALMDRCTDVVNADIERDPPNAPSLPSIDGSLSFHDVRLDYPSTGFSFGSVSLDIDPGETVAIVGPSGAGKSTLLDLVGRLVEPVAGSITLDGHDIAAHRRASVRANIGLLTQEPFLFTGTLRDNFRLGQPAATDDEIFTAARAAHAAEIIARLPHGLDTMLERRGLNLSTGQRQRIALARCMLRRPRLLLLDEPSSALDAESERLLVESLREFCRSRTTLIVTHRPALLALARRIIVLHRGRIVDVVAANGADALGDDLRRLREMAMAGAEP
jgi:ATP-binding cassette subfamily B protein